MGWCQSAGLYVSLLHLSTALWDHWYQQPYMNIVDIPRSLSSWLNLHRFCIAEIYHILGIISQAIGWYPYSYYYAYWILHWFSMEASLISSHRQSWSKSQQILGNVTIVLKWFEIASMLIIVHLRLNCFGQVGLVDDHVVLRPEESRGWKCDQCIINSKLSQISKKRF